MRAKILNPKKYNLTGKNKPIVLIVHSPHDKKDSATNYDLTVQFVKSMGYGILSKSKLTFDKNDKGSLNDCIRPIKNYKKITLWFSSHGSSGWMFGPENKEESYEVTEKNEFEWTVKFAEFVRKIEQHLDVEIENIILTGCFTANEIMNRKESTYFNSPARVVSYLLPEKKIIGFIGTNAQAKITGLYERNKMNQDEYNELFLSQEVASVLFQNGGVIEKSVIEAYCNHKYTPKFIFEACKLDIKDDEKATIMYQPCLAKEIIEKEKIYTNENCYGNCQLRLIKIELATNDKLALSNPNEEFKIQNKNY